MTDDERAALKWLEIVAEHANDELQEMRARAAYARTLIRLLDRPTIPRGEDVPDDVVSNMIYAYYNTAPPEKGMRAAINVLREYVTAPPPVKKVEAWALLEVGNKEPFGLTFNKEYAVDLAARGFRIIKLIEAADADQ